MHLPAGAEAHRRALHSSGLQRYCDPDTPITWCEFARHPRAANRVEAWDCIRRPKRSGTLPKHSRSSGRRTRVIQRAARSGRPSSRSHSRKPHSTRPPRRRIRVTDSIVTAAIRTAPVTRIIGDPSACLVEWGYGLIAASFSQSELVVPGQLYKLAPKQ
jgi:hypothetical protein